MEGEKSATEYLESSGVCGIVEDALREMLTTAINNPYQVRFNPLDFIVVYLYKNNPNFVVKRSEIDTLWEIPFVQEKWKETPRSDLPLSARLTKHSAATILQSAWRGYVARKDEIVQDFRVWQREVREEKRAAGVLIKCLKDWTDRKRNSIAEYNGDTV